MTLTESTLIIIVIVFFGLGVLTGFLIGKRKGYDNIVEEIEKHANCRQGEHWWTKWEQTIVDAEPQGGGYVINTYGQRRECQFCGIEEIRGV